MRDTLDQLDDPAGGLPWLREAVDLYESGDPLDMSAEPPFFRGMAVLDRRLHLGLPWCGVFVAHCLVAALPDVNLPRRHPRARPWCRWGHPVDPQVGAVLVFWHLHPRLPFGHTGFYWAEDADCFHVLGGNQRDEIRITRYPKDRLVACRWPDGQDEPGRRRAAAPARALPSG